MTRFQTLTCPNCGAPLSIPDEHQQYFRCDTCGMALEDTAYEEPTPTIHISVAAPGFDLDQLTAYTQTTRPPQVERRGGCVTLLVLLVLLVGGGVALAVWQFSDAVDGAIDTIDGQLPSSDGYEIYSFASGHPLAAADESNDDLLLLARAADGQRVMYLDFDADPVTRWTTASADAAVGAHDPVAATHGTVFVAAERYIYAFDRLTGTPQFTIGIPDVIAPYCTDCLRIFDGAEPTLTALTSDGTLHAFRAETGAPRWSQRLPSDLTRQIIDIGGHPAVIAGTNGSDGVVRVFDTSSGEPRSEQVPACTDRGGRVTAVDRLLASTDGGFIWIGDDGFDGCAERWAPGATAPTWHTMLPGNPGVVQLQTDDAVLLGDHTVVPGRGALWLIGNDDGSVRVVERPETDEIVPISISTTTLFIAEHSARGSGTWSLVGIPLDDTRPIWQLALDGDILDPDSLVVPNQIGWLAIPVDGSVVVMSVDDRAERVEFSLIDGATGTASTPVLLDVPADPLGLSAIFDIDAGRVTLGINRGVVVVDATSGQIVDTAP